MPIICATNFSDAAHRSCDAAAQLARKSGDTLWLVHVLPSDSARAFGKALLEAAEAALGDEARRLEKLGVKVERALLTGEPAAALQELATKQGAQLVVTAAPSHETPFLGMGGTVDRLAEALHMPLLVARQEAALEAWARGTRPLKVMLGVDRSLPFERAREWVKGLRKLGPVEVVGGRIFWPQEEALRLGLERPLSFGEVSPALRQALDSETAALVAPLAEGSQPVRVRLEPGLGRIADHLVALAAEEQVDVLVVGTHQRQALGKLWSVSHHALRLAKMSVVSVPVQGSQDPAVALPQVRTLLVTTDFSELGDRAIAYARALVPAGGRLHLLHVIPSRGTPEQEHALRQQLEQRVPGATGQGNHEVQVEVVAGTDVAGLIAQAAERHGADLICMGTHGRTGLARAVMGSVAQAVMARSDRPVLMVRNPAS
ncbi:universal stress protein [Stigmatella aurantiaca]|uniref:Universal stress protein family n=1 Tax=Stigmatella aurantiaca (strain DW4/3-1) TaxID=378806 RepID=Q08Q59_STIAD|nr:universal stress protein [Stigmatella aurantiaca]ADO71003.1 Universal stress protein family [Stigmatella aurantiaca DW4/3-1]EAU62607.1 universal stress protein family [Stigmatella aurantiaca DW4/3-1]